MSCLFCDIANKKIDTCVVYDDEQVTAFNDINPQAPTHILIIPKIHIETINEAEKSHESLLGHMVFVAQKIARQEGFHDNGYRLIFNVNAQGGQTVYHIHLHLLGGRQMTWPPG